MNAADSRKLLVAQLLATRDTLLATVSQVDTSLLALGVDVDTLGEPSLPACEHPEDRIENLHTTLDDAPDDWICHACGARSPLPFHPE
jgi:hypothetical protein